MGLHRLNPYTIYKIVATWQNEKMSFDTPMYILDIASTAKCWPATLYKAAKLGYLRRTHAAYYKPTEYCIREYKEILHRKETKY